MTMVILMFGTKTITHPTMKSEICSFILFYLKDCLVMHAWMVAQQTLTVSGVSVNAMLTSPKAGGSAVAPQHQKQVLTDLLSTPLSYFALILLGAGLWI